MSSCSLAGAKNHRVVLMRCFDPVTSGSTRNEDKPQCPLAVIVWSEPFHSKSAVERNCHPVLRNPVLRMMGLRKRE